MTPLLERIRDHTNKAILILDDLDLAIPAGEQVHISKFIF
jgi:hypothetical protein